MLKVSVSGIRGIWGESLDHQIILDYVKAFVKMIGKNKKWVIGTDTRKTRKIIKNLVLSVLESYGGEIIDLDITATPLVLFAVREKEADAGIMISASHNPAPWNALKLIKKGGFFLNDQEIKTLSSIYEKKDFLSYSFQEIGKTSSYPNIVHDYIAKVKNYVDCSVIRQSGLKVVVDAVNGTANTFIHNLLYFLNIQHQILFSDMEKDFERGPEPLPENLTILSQKVKETQADLGLAFDPDGDRVAIVDEKGNPIGEDWTLAIAYLNVLQKEKTDIAINFSTSMIIEEIAKKYNTKVYYGKVGEIHITEKMLEKNLIIGGEGNGGVIYQPINYCRDSLIATLFILEYLAKTKNKISEITHQFPKIFIVKDKVQTSKTFDARALESVMRDYFLKSELNLRHISLEDGIRIDYENGWIQVRASNTEPIIRIMGENTNPAINEQLVRWIKTIL